MKLNKLFFLLIPIFVSAFGMKGQEQFSSRIIKYSSQSGSKAYAAKQVLGIPNALEYGKNPVAWSPAAPNIGMEYIEVGFSRPMKIQQVAIWENFNPGAVFQIHLVEKNGKSHKVFEQDKPDKAGSGNRIFRYMMKQTNYEVASLKLVLNTAGVYGLNQIDAIGISSSSRPMESVINVPKDKSFVGKPENLGYTVNCADPDLLPIISVDGQNLYFARKHHVNNIGANKNDDIYISNMDRKGGWTEAVNIGAPLNNQFNNFVCAVNPDGTEVLLSGRYDYRGISKEGLHRTYLRNGVWANPEPIVIEGYNNKSAFVCYHVSPDMKYLVIAMEHPDTHGDMDIYVSFKKSNGRYSVPKNLGATINTAGTEPSVFLSADGRTIYFSSDGHPGYGAYDMYMSRRMDNTWTSWTEPVNLGPDINTADWDLYYTVPANGEYAYYSSEHNSYGRSDLYRIKLPKDVRPEPVAIVKPTFVNVKTNDPVANVNSSNKTIIIQDDSKLNLYEEVKGYYPVNESEDLSAELEEEDDFAQETDQGEEDPEMDQKMEDLLARLQELKNEQAKTSTEYEDVLEPVTRHDPVASPQKTVSAAPTPTVIANDLDDRLAALRSDMERISQGELPENTYDKTESGNSYNVKPAYKTSDKETEREAEMNGKQTETLDRYEQQEEAISEMNNEYRSPVSPRGNTRQSYDLRDKSGNDYMADHQNYRDRLEELKKQKSGVTTQPLSKYAIAKSAIDEQMEEELAASSLNSELDELKERQQDPENDNPELEAYRKKLEELTNENKYDDLPTANQFKKEDPDELAASSKAEEVDEEVLAFQKKLDEMKVRMNDYPVIQAEDEEAMVASVPKNDAESLEVAEVSRVDPENTGKVNMKEARAKFAKVNRKKTDADIPGPQIINAIVPINSDKVGRMDRITDVEEVTEAKQVKAVMPDEEADVIVEAATTQNEEEDKQAEQQQELDKIQEEISELGIEADAVRQTNDVLNQEKQQLEKERLAMESQKQELEDVIAQLEGERQAFLDEQEKLESDRKQLENLRLQQHQQVKKLENEIAELEREKGVALTAANEARSTTPVALDPDAEIFLMPVEAGVTVEIRNVFFNANSAYIKPQSYKELDKVVSFLKVNSNITVEIGGHTNGICQTSFCNSLSEKRAKAVSEYLTNKGIPSLRLEYRGYGKQSPIADNSTADGRKKNQRVELKIIKVD